MTQHDNISSYIDNELSHEQEQDFLISLASSEALRKSFRSELVLKNIVHRDDALTTPSRDMRPAVLATLGIVTVAGVTETAHGTAVAAKSSVLKTLFATKLNAIITASLVSVSAIGGYAVRSYVAPSAPAPTTIERQVNNNNSLQTPTSQPHDVQTPVENISPVSLGSAPDKVVSSKAVSKKHLGAQTTTQMPTITNIGSGGVTVEPPIKIKP